MNLSIDIRLKAYLHWLWHGGQPPKMDPSEQPQRKQPSQRGTAGGGGAVPTTTWPGGKALSAHSARSGKKRVSNLEHIAASSMHSGRSMRSNRSVRSDGAGSVHSVASNASNASSHHSLSDDCTDDLGPVLMVDILVTEHVDVRMSCYQLAMAAKMCSNLSIILKQRALKKSVVAQRRRSVQMNRTPTAATPNAQPPGLQRTASAPATSREDMHRRDGHDRSSSTHRHQQQQQQQQQRSSRNSQGWMSWVGSFFYDVWCSLNILSFLSLKNQSVFCIDHPFRSLIGCFIRCSV